MQLITPAPPLLQTIVRWNHNKGGKAHCLARLYRQDDRGIVVLSEIRSNDRHRGLMLDLAGAATAMIPTFSDMGIEPESMTWLIHHGSFSDYEPLQQEEWGQASFHWNGNQYESDQEKWKSLQSDEIEELHRWIELASVFEVLNALAPPS